MTSLKGSLGTKVKPLVITGSLVEAIEIQHASRDN